MKRKITVGLFLGLVSLGLPGCGAPESKNMMQGVDKSAVEEYEAMIEAGNNAMSQQDDSATP